MSQVFGFRSLVYWWGILSATVFVRDWLQQLVGFLREPTRFVSQNLPFSVVPGINGWIDGVAKYIRDTVKFNPSQIVATIGPVTIQGWVLAVVVGLIFFGAAVGFYIRALKSSSWYDDFLALFVIYVVLRVIGHIVALASLPFATAFRMFVDNPTTAYFVIIILLLGLSFIGEGFRSKRAFWRALIAALLISFLMFPAETARAFSYVVEALAFFGNSLDLKQNAAFAIAWGAIGIGLALQRLTTQEAAS